MRFLFVFSPLLMDSGLTLNENMILKTVFGTAVICLKQREIRPIFSIVIDHFYIVLVSALDQTSP